MTIDVVENVFKFEFNISPGVTLSIIGVIILTGNNSD